MEKIKNEIIVKMLCKYINEKVICKSTEYHKNAIGQITNFDLNLQIITVDNQEYYLDEDDIKLILMPLSKIRPKDLIEISNISGTLSPENLIRAIENKQIYAIEIKSGIEIYQFLEQNGYDIPQRELDNKTLQQSGLAIYE